MNQVLCLTGQGSSHSPKNNIYFFVCLFCVEGWCLPLARWLLTLTLPPYPPMPIGCAGRGCLRCAQIWLFFSDALYICHNCFIFCDSFFICSSFNTQYFTFIIMHWQFGLNQAEQHCTLSVQSCSYSTTVQPGLSRGSVDYSSNQVSPVCTRSFQSIIDIDHHNFR